LVPLKIVSNVSRLKPALNLNRVLADLNRGSNYLNSISGQHKAGYMCKYEINKTTLALEACHFSLKTAKLIILWILKIN